MNMDEEGSPDRNIESPGEGPDHEAMGEYGRKQHFQLTSLVDEDMGGDPNASPGQEEMGDESMAVGMDAMDGAAQEEYKHQ